MANSPSQSASKTPNSPFHPAILLVAGVFLLLLWVVPHVMTSAMQTSPVARLTLETQIRDTWAKMLWAGVTLLAASLVWRYLQKLGQVVENSSQTLAAAERTAFFTAQAAETERYARSMALLGDDKIEVRLGGIYALERLARESERDHGPITEVLAAFAREHTAWSDGETAPARLSADVQAILSVLSRRHTPFDRLETRIDLHGTALARAYLPYAQLEGAWLYESNLEGAMLQGANLRGAWCWKSSWAGAILEGAHLEGADLTGAAGLTLGQIQSAHRDETTKLPAHLQSEVAPAPPTAQEDLEERAQEEANLKLPTRRAAL